MPRLDELFLAKVRELEKTVERDVLRARQALISSIETPIPLHPVDGVLEAEIGVKAPLPLVVGGVSELMVAGAGFGNYVPPCPGRFGGLSSASLARTASPPSSSAQRPQHPRRPVEPVLRHQPHQEVRPARWSLSMRRACAALRRSGEADFSRARSNTGLDRLRAWGMLPVVC